MRVRRVLQQDDAALLAERLDLAGVRGYQPGDVHEHDGGRPRREGRGDGVRAERERRGVDVGEHRAAAGPQDRGGRRVERVGRDDHVPALDADSAQRDFQRGGAAGDGDGVVGVMRLRECGLELLGVRPERERAGGQYAGDGFRDLGPVVRRKHDPCCLHSQTGTPCCRPSSDTPDPLRPTGSGPCPGHDMIPGTSRPRLAVCTCLCAPWRA